MVGAALTLVFLMIVSIPFALAEDAAKPPTAPVELDGKLLFTIQAGTKAFTPELRATQIAARIKALAADCTFRPERIATSDLEFATEISGDGRFIRVVFDADAKAEGVILHTSVTIGYDAAWETVHGLLIEAAKVTSHILEAPHPFVLQTAMNDFYVAYELNAYTDAPQFMPRGSIPNSTRISRTNSMRRE